MKKVIIKTKTLSLSLLKNITGCIPSKLIACIQADHVDVGAIDACLGMGIALRLQHASCSRADIDRDASFQRYERHVEDNGLDELEPLLDTARRLGIRLVMARSDLSGLRAASREEAESVISNATTRVRLPDDNPGDSVAGHNQPDGIGAQHIFSDAAQKLLDAGYIRGQTYDQCLEMAKWHPGMRDVLNSMGPDGSETQRRYMGFAFSILGGGEADQPGHGDEENRVFAQKARKLFAAGYLYGQTYDQCLEMAKWHYGMASYIQTELPGRVGDEEHRKAFEQARKHLAGMTSGPHIDFLEERELHHRTIWGKTLDGMRQGGITQGLQ